MTEPSLDIDWEAGEGSVDLGEQFLEQPPLFQLDVLSDWLEDLTELRAEAFEATFPGQEQIEREQANLRRRLAMETLVGQTITSAQLLSTGHVVMVLSNGATVALVADTPLSLVPVASVEAAHARGDRMGFGRRHLEEPSTTAKR